MDLSKYKKVLAFFAHPDDETLAAGATINRLCSLGAEVHVAIPATGINSRRNIKEQIFLDAELERLHFDCERAMGVLGVKSENIYLGEFSDNEMDKHSLLELIHWLEKIVCKVQPDLILTHHRYCTNIDHQYCHEAVIVASRPNLNNHITIMCGEVPSSTGYLRPAQWEPNCYVAVSGEDVDIKIKAMQAYKGESRPDPHPRSPEVLKSLAKVRGSESGFYFAEAFVASKIYL